MKKPNVSNPFNKKGEVSDSDGRSSKGGESPPRQSSSGNGGLNAAFLGALVAGSAAIFLSWQQEVSMLWTVLWPSFVMGVYIAYSCIKAKTFDLRDQVGDSQYYLGFLLTLVALGVSMVDLALTENAPDQSGLIGRIGLALATTVIGLTSRLLLTQFHLSVDENMERTHESIARQSGEFMQALTESVEGFKKANQSVHMSLRQAGNAYTKRVEELTGQNTSAIENLATGTETRIATIMTQLSVKISQFELFPGDAKQRLEDSIKEFETSLSSCAAALEQTNIAAQRNVEISQSIQTTLSGVGQSMERLKNTEADFAGLSDTVGSITTALADFESSLASNKTAFSETVGRMAEQKTLVAELQAQIKQEVASINSVRQTYVEDSEAVTEVIKDVILELTSAMSLFAEAIRSQIPRN